MRSTILIALFSALLCSCSRDANDQTSNQGTSGSGTIYGRGGGNADDHQRAQENATDTRPRGGSMPGAGGAGPGYDGSRQGTTEKDFVPAPGSGVGAGLTNSNPITNSPPPARELRSDQPNPSAEGAAPSGPDEQR